MEEWKNYCKLNSIWEKELGEKKRIRLKFYRAMKIYLKMSCHSEEYMKGYFDGSGVDQETRAFIEFINR